MMDMKNKIFAVENVSLHDLEEHLNELAVEGWRLHSIDYVGRDEANLPSYTVIAHSPYNWEARFEEHRKKWQAELDAEKKAISAGKDAKEAWEAVEKWELTMGTTGGHANE